MKRSTVLLGLPAAKERSLNDAVGGDVKRFFTLAQRVAWGLTQPDLCRADADGSAAALAASHGQAFPAHLFEAWVWRARDPDRAQQAIERARALATPDHPLRYLLPSDAEWACESPPMRLVEVVPGAIWRVRHSFPMVGAPFELHSTATIVRGRDGDVAFINPIALSDELAAQVRALGPVRWVCSQGKVHSKYVDAVGRRFPGSIVLGTEGHLEHAPAAHLELDGLLGSYEGLPSELELLPVRGHVLKEVLILHRPTATLIVQDFVTNNEPGGATFVGRLYGFAFGLADRIGFMSYNALLWQDMGVLHDSLRRIKDSGFSRILGAHWPVEPCTGKAFDAFNEAIDCALEMSPFAHKVHLGRYFWSQPGFLRDLIRYQRATKGKAGARLRPTQ